MSYQTRGLSWISSRAAEILSAYRKTAEALALKPLVEDPHELERMHGSVSRELCRYIARLERFRNYKEQDYKKWIARGEP